MHATTNWLIQVEIWQCCLKASTDDACWCQHRVLSSDTMASAPVEVLIYTSKYLGIPTWLALFCQGIYWLETDWSGIPTIWQLCETPCYKLNSIHSSYWIWAFFGIGTTCRSYKYTLMSLSRWPFIWKGDWHSGCCYRWVHDFFPFTFLASMATILSVLWSTVQ